MKKRILFTVQIFVLVLFVFSFLAAILQLSGSSNPLSKVDHNGAVYNNIEQFDPSLSRLNSLKKLEHYCDSIYAAKAFAGGPVEFERTYTDIASQAVRNRFYHGYSYYAVADNYVSAFISKLTIPGLNALVIPDEILKYPYAACSQQSIVMMEVLKDKGFKTRKITFLSKSHGGHFAFEVFYGGDWHFFDPNMEPDNSLLNNYGRPGIDFLVRNPGILTSAYRHYPTEEILDIFPTYSYGPVNKFPAPRAMFFQKTTRFLSYSIWLFFLILLILVRRKYLRLARKSFAEGMVAVPRIQSKVTPAIYPGYSAHGS